jgi:hypothetical protein
LNGDIVFSVEGFTHGNHIIEEFLVKIDLGNSDFIDGSLFSSQLSDLFNFFFSIFNEFLSSSDFTFKSGLLSIESGFISLINFHELSLLSSDSITNSLDEVLNSH